MIAQRTSEPASVAAEAESLRRDRDRFAALAFCAADILFELDDAQEIVFATGAVQALLGRAPDQLIGRPLAEVATPEYGGLVRAVLSGARAQNRMNPVSVRLQGATAPTPPLQTSGYFLPNLPQVGGRYYLAMRLDADQIGPARNRDPVSGLLDANDFSRSVARRLGRDGLNEPQLKMTLVQVGNLEVLRRRLDEEARTALTATIGAYLRANSVDGDTAGQFDSERFGVLRDGTESIAPVWRHLREFSRAIDPQGVGVDIADADFDPKSLGIDNAELSRDDIARVLIHAINAFDTAHQGDVTLDDMSRDLSGIALTTMERIKRFRKTVKDGSFKPVFQPIVDIASGRPHHFEALARFPSDPALSPGSDIQFAEDVGLITEFDLKMTRKVIEWLRSSNKMGMRYNIAINLSGRSLMSRAFVKTLLKLLENAGDVRHQILFELTESARIAALTQVAALINQLRNAGHIICLDDFGAGASTFHYLRAFDVDVVKIDGSLVHEAVSSHKGMAFLTAIVGICDDLGIVTVAEKIETARALEIVRQAGVTLAQGHLFGEPTSEVSAFDAPRPSCFEGRRRAAG